MRRWLWWVLVLPLWVALPVRASETYWPGGALEVAPSSSCARTSNTGTNHVYTSMACTQTGTQQFVAHAEVNPDAGLTFTVNVFWIATSGAGSNVCWTIKNATGSQYNYDIVAGGNSTNMVGIPNIGANLVHQSISGNMTLYNALTAADCTADACDSKPITLFVARDNSAGCASNMAASAKVIGVRLDYN